MRRTIFFVRHGETDWNAEARLQGQRDIPLNAVGRRQAAKVGQGLAEVAPDHRTLPYVASPLGRTRETMELMRESAGIPRDGYALDPLLIELSFGQWEGRTWREVRKSDPARAAERERNKWNFVPPGGESYDMLARRIAPALEALPERSVMVSHGGVARAILKTLCGLPEAKAPLVDIWQGRVLVIDDGAYFWH